ncbi:hypothetical protein [Paramagnetospirillum magneticum]|uniref:hypothetical protein n=1 Tax=Paramagnetospirillum magneticum TaxID=84159 RepID=UPI0011D088DF|nr:hypothetical protein [Paramagnetospirillum magneticum]
MSNMNVANYLEKSTNITLTGRDDNEQQAVYVSINEEESVFCENHSHIERATDPNGLDDLTSRKMEELVCKINDIWSKVKHINDSAIGARNGCVERESGGSKSDRRDDIERLLAIKRSYGVEYSRILLSMRDAEFQDDVIGHLQIINDKIIGGILDLGDLERFDFSDAELTAVELNYEYCIECEEIRDNAEYAIYGKYGVLAEICRALERHRTKLRMLFSDAAAKVT